MENWQPSAHADFCNEKKPPRAFALDGGICGRSYTRIEPVILDQHLHSEVLDADLLHIGLLDLVREPSRSICRLVYHLGPALEHVDSLGSALSQPDVRVVSGSSL